MFSDFFILAIIFLIGLCLGSFLNVVIFRLTLPGYTWKDFFNVKARSYCPHCKHALAWFDLVPVVSFLWPRGNCRYCSKKISIQYPLVEMLTALLFVVCVWRFGFGWKGFGAMVLTGYLIALSGIDLRTKLLPDQLTLPLLWLGLVAAIENLYIGQKTALLGAIAGYLSLWSVYWVFKQLTGKEGMGHGDFKLLAALGAWTGLAGVLPTVLISSLVGAVIGSIWLATQGRDKATPIPFGPYLAIAGWITFFWGGQLVGMYTRYAGLA